MVNRGKLLILAGLCLVTAPAIMRMVEASRAQNAALSAGIQTQGSQIAQCSKTSVETVIGRLGCQQVDGNRRSDSSGAVFVSATNR